MTQRALRLDTAGDLERFLSKRPHLRVAKGQSLPWGASPPAGGGATALQLVVPEEAASESPAPEATNKYHNRITYIDGIKFDSEREAGRFCQLRLLLRAGHILSLFLQFPFRLGVNGVHVCTYYADFVYWLPDGRMVVEDAKGVRTPAYVLKRKLMLAVHGIRIVEV